MMDHKIEADFTAGQNLPVLHIKTEAHLQAPVVVEEEDDTCKGTFSNISTRVKEEIIDSDLEVDGPERSIEDTFGQTRIKEEGEDQFFVVEEEDGHDDSGADSMQKTKHQGNPEMTVEIKTECYDVNQIETFPPSAAFLSTTLGQLNQSNDNKLYKNSRDKDISRADCSSLDSDTLCQKNHTPNTPMVKCQVCNKQFDTLNKFKIHKRGHTRHILHHCEICGKGFFSKYNYQEHMTIHTGKALYKCDLCEKPFRYKGLLKEHLHLHAGTFLCPVCGRVFNRKTTLNSHKCSGSLYKCNVCYEMFNYANVFSTHMETHKFDYPYYCDICLKRYVRLSALRKHVKAHKDVKSHLYLRNV